MIRKRMRRVIILCIIILAMSLAGCEDAIEVDELVYVASLGIDKGVSDYWRISVKYPIMKKATEETTGQPGGAEYGSMTMDAPSFFTAIDMIDSIISRHLNFQHMKFIVFSEEIARSGELDKYLAPILRFREIRRTAHVLICRGEASKFIETNNPALGTSLTKNIEDWAIQMRLTGFYPYSTLKDFYNGTKSYYEQPAAILASCNEGQNFIDDGPKAETSTNIKAEYLAGDIPSTGGNKVELFGSAIFNGDTMVDTLNGYETRLMLMVTGEFNEGRFTVPDPIDESLVVSLRFETSRTPAIKVDVKGDEPKVAVEIKIDAEILGMQGVADYERDELRPVLEQAVASALEADMRQLFEKCQSRNADVFGFGGIAARHFATVDQWTDYAWFDRFADADIDAKVEIRIRRSGTFLKTNPTAPQQSGGTK